jgi:hypothetical protein
LAISLSLEASELLENFQWKSSEDAVSQKKQEIADELADVPDLLDLSGRCAGPRHRRHHSEQNAAERRQISGGEVFWQDDQI